jgi:two-component system CheB/CheR fusion protein
MSEIEQSSAAPQNDLVVVGSSAGGVEALSILVSSLPNNFPAPIVIAQHLDPNSPSNLDTILQRRTVLPVIVVGEKTLLQPGTIFVVPANRHVAILDGHVEVRGDLAKRPRPSVDLLLSTAASVFGEHLIAVILTGSGSDGAAGAVNVKNAGGTVIVQDPQTARYPSMPMALPPTVVDFEVDIERIGPLLFDLLNGEAPPLAEDKSEDILHHILEQVNRQASIDFRPYKTSTILRRIGRRMTVTHCRTMRDYLEYLRTYPEEVGELVQAFLINVTQFFRDADAFAYLKSDVLPKLIARARERDRSLRFWAAGCATGEEAYSLAMLIADLLGSELSNWSVKVFATDLDEAAITFARRGLYSNNLLEGVPPDYIERFFTHTDNTYQISKNLRQMVIFGQQDLSRSAPFPRIDAVLCRNVLIYFTPELQDYVLNQFAFSLAPGGYLLLGKAETVRPTQAYYELVSKHWKVYRCTSNPLPSVKRPNNSPEVRPQQLERYSSVQSSRSDGKQPEQEIPAAGIEQGQLRRFNELLLRFLPIGIVIIDRAYHILTANGAARRLLSLRETGNKQDFLHSVHGIPYPEVRAAIDAVFRERTTMTLPEVELDISIGGSGQFLSLSIALMPIEGGAQDLAVISVTDVTEQVQTRRQLETVQVEQAHLMNELSVTNKRLNDVNKEQLDANEKLQVANEELVLTQEELQASIEEFETTNEELQATNEELETNNEELQATNEELETTNDELRARSNELQEITSMLASERKQLAEMVELAPFYIMVLRGPNLLVDAFSPNYANLMQGYEVQGRPFETVFELFWEPGMPIVRLAYEVYMQDTTRITPRILMRVRQASGDVVENYFVYTLVPSHDAHGKVSGVIIYAKNETEERVREIEVERARLKLVFDHTDIAALALFDAVSTELLLGSPHYLDLIAKTKELDPSSLIGRKWHELTLIAPPEEASSLWDEAMASHVQVRVSEIHLKLSPDTPETVLDCYLTPIMDSDKPGDVRFMLVSAIEVTEQTQAREEIEQLNRLKDDFLSLASHELRTPLTSIVGNTELLQRNLRRMSNAGGGESKGNFERERSTIDRILHQTTRLTRLIDEMLDITRIRSEQFEVIAEETGNIVEAVRRVVENYAVGADHPLSFNAKEETIMGSFDGARMEQLLGNLINNAFKYSEAGKPVDVSVERIGNEAMISVKDEGRGIDQEQQTHIFDRFYRVHPSNHTNVEGLGLGLYICHEIVTKLGGRIWLESEPGQGSTFYVSLPLEEEFL